MINTEKFRKTLQKRLQELDVRLHGIEDELDSHQSKDWEELAVEREEEEVLEGLGTSGQDEIVKIRAALRRIDEGEFGICVKCCDEISEERLAVVPHTPYCQKCA
ncbi:TraR/DksA family transcriptional regulator [Aliiroseovarius lamellibrachiae]|uniref:TraR/DksA family transcriptional regulator n=1 Tax=Aliiroseovarius lamellibrachiae TaxID=1924933 RepID=UPI001BE0AC66|nr:TraR/DksA C4-type zinc finger protein [Aliiroseovarius lamellibrachiae]MBT2130081.1 TraR/DksA family transcriptional regulator [Aliiroseovarius lamellibrachiae]